VYRCRRAGLGSRLSALRLPGRRGSGEASHEDSVWARWADAVTRHPWIAFASALGIWVYMAPYG